MISQLTPNAVGARSQRSIFNCIDKCPGARGDSPYIARRQKNRDGPEHLPRERIVYPVPTTCPCCGDGRLRKLGEDVTETLELVPRQWKVIQHVREKLVCRA